MLSLTKWIYIIKNLLESNLSNNKIREIILERCLLSKRKFLGSYQVNSQKIWDYIISKDKKCCMKLDKLNIKNVTELISYYEEIEYKKMRRTYPKNHHKRGA